MSTVSPKTRDEMYLADIAGDSIELDCSSIIPKTRKEIYLAFLDGVSDLSVDELPEPRTREEMYLYDMCVNGGMSGGSGDGHVKISEAKYEALVASGAIKADTIYDVYTEVN